MYVAYALLCRDSRRTAPGNAVGHGLCHNSSGYPTSTRRISDQYFFLLRNPNLVMDIHHKSIITIFFHSRSGGRHCILYIIYMKIRSILDDLAAPLLYRLISSFNGTILTNLMKNNRFYIQFCFWRLVWAR